MTPRTFHRLFDYTGSLRIKRPDRAYRQELGDAPTYSIPEAAAFLAIPTRTLTSWFSGSSRLFQPAGDYRNYSLLSFKDVAESYALYVLRHFYRFTPNDIKNALSELRKETSSRHPFLSLDLSAADKKLLLNRPAHGKRPRAVLDLMKYRNQVFPEFADAYSRRIFKDERGNTQRIFPWRFFDEDQTSQPVSMDPNILSGRLVVTGTRIPVTVLLGLKIAGRKEEQIAKSYDLDVDVVRKALRHIERPVQKVA